MCHIFYFPFPYVKKQTQFRNLYMAIRFSLNSLGIASARGNDNTLNAVLKNKLSLGINEGNQNKRYGSEMSQGTFQGRPPAYYWMFTTEVNVRNSINPSTLKEAKTGLTILNIFIYQKYFLKYIWRRNVYHNITNNSPSNIL